MSKMDEKSFERRKKNIEGVFTCAILILFIVFLLLLTRTQVIWPRYVVGAVLVIIALIYKKVDKMLKVEEENIIGSKEDNKKEE